MRSLTETLLTAQQQSATIPYVKVEVNNKIAGVVRYGWSRLYTGSEDDYYHALTIPGDGSLVRARVTLPADSRKLYRQRVADPAPDSDFSQWTYINEYNAVVVAAASLGSEVSIVWIKTNREIRRIKSTDYGANWGSSELVDYTPTTAINGLAAAYKPGGDLALFYADQATLYAQKCVSGQWQNRAAWDKTAGDLSGVAVVYDGDWNLLVTGQDSTDNYKLWSLIYGDGGDVAAGSWSELKELASAPSGGDFEYRQPFLDSPDVYRGFFVEKFTGNQSYNCPFWTHSVLDTGFIDSLWREPVPFNLSSEYGLAIAHHGEYCWLSVPAGVWRAALAPASLDLSADVIGVRQEVGAGEGRIAIELRNDCGQYASPGQGSLAVLDIGAQLDFSPGYVTTGGSEVSSGQTFSIESYEHTSSGGKASLVLHAGDGWKALSQWRARHQFRWNKSADNMNVKDILALVLARAGLKLEVISQSSVVTGFYPDFTISPGTGGREVITRLLSFVPDVIFIEGCRACLVNPLPADSSVYSYGNGHRIFDGSYRTGAWGINRVQVEGYDTGSEDVIIVESFQWDEIDRLYDRLQQLQDRNIRTAAAAGERGDAWLREAGIESVSGNIQVPVNCGQQLYDVIDITDSRAGLSAAKRRVLGWVLVYHPYRGDYYQRLSLGAV